LVANDAAVAASDGSASVGLDSTAAPADAAPLACGSSLSCPMGEVCVAQVGLDGGVGVTRCMADIQCEPATLARPSCICPICGPEPTIQCMYGPFYGNLTAVECGSR
jgi:hypothetical protein